MLNAARKFSESLNSEARKNRIEAFRRHLIESAETNLLSSKDTLFGTTLDKLQRMVDTAVGTKLTPYFYAGEEAPEFAQSKQTAPSEVELFELAKLIIIKDPSDIEFLDIQIGMCDLKVEISDMVNKLEMKKSIPSNKNEPPEVNNKNEVLYKNIVRLECHNIPASMISKICRIDDKDGIAFEEV